MPRFINDRTYASNPGGLGLSKPKAERLWKLQPFLWRFLSGFRTSLERELEYLEEHLKLGDSRAAVVMTTTPLLVAAYTDELDCIAMLEFPGELAREHELSAGDRLLTVNTYYAQGPAPDLAPGPNRYDNWKNFRPAIAQFLSSSKNGIESAMANIPDAEYERCTEMGLKYLRRPGCRVRNGAPFASHLPADKPPSSPPVIEL